MYSSAYVYIYTYGFVYIFCIDIQIGLILSKYQVFCADSVTRDVLTIYLFSASVLLFLIWGMVTLFLLKLLSYCFCSRVALFKVFLCFLLPMVWDLHHSILMLQHVNFAFIFNVQHAMEVFLFRLINICWSLHCFCFVATLQFSPLPDIILYFWINPTSAVFHISVYLILLVLWSVFLFGVLWNKLPFSSVLALCRTLQITGKVLRKMWTSEDRNFQNSRDEGRRVV